MALGAPFKAMASLSAAPATAPAPGDPEPESATAEEIQRVIDDLQDPEARAELIRELEILKQARAETGEDVPLSEISVDNLVARSGRALEEFWQTVAQVDVTWLAVQMLWTLLVLVAVALIYRAVRRGMRRLDRHLSRQEAEPPPSRPAMVIGKRLLRVALALLGLAVVLQIWGVSLSEWITGIARLEWVQTAITLVLLALATLVAWSLADSLIASTMNTQARRIGNARHRSRLKTVTPLIQGAVRIGIAVLAGLLILAELGVNIGPLLAGAGIIGLAVGFGAQSLIKDLLIGVTLLLEDAASVGDIIDVNGHIGEVEEMGIRMMRLRDLEGAVYLIPYSEVSVVKNLTKDFAFAMLDIGVAYRESVDEVIESLVATAREMRDDPDLGPLILDDLEVMGVNAFADSSVVVRVRLKTIPLERWRIAREYRRRIKTSFDSAGIEIPFPHRTLYFGADKKGHAEPLRLVESDAEGSS